MELRPAGRVVGVLGFPRERHPPQFSPRAGRWQSGGGLLLIYASRSQASVAKAARGFCRMATRSWEVASPELQSPKSHRHPRQLRLKEAVWAGGGRERALGDSHPPHPCTHTLQGDPVPGTEQTPRAGHSPGTSAKHPGVSPPHPSMSGMAAPCRGPPPVGRVAPPAWQSQGGGDQAPPTPLGAARMGPGGSRDRTCCVCVGRSQAPARGLTLKKKKKKKKPKVLFQALPFSVVGFTRVSKKVG